MYNLCRLNDEIILKNNFSIISKYTYFSDKAIEKELEQNNLDLLSKNKRVRELKIFIDSLEKKDELLTEYDTKLFNYLVDAIIIHKGKRVEFHIKNGEVISI